MDSVTELGVMPNRSGLPSYCTHSYPIHGLCKITALPDLGSMIFINYLAKDHFLEYLGLARYIASFRHGKQIGDLFIRDMEQTIQQIAKDAAKAVRVPVTVNTTILIRGAVHTLTVVGFVDGSVIIGPYDGVPSPAGEAIFKTNPQTP